MDVNGIKTIEAQTGADVFPLDDAAIESLAELDQQDKMTHSARLGILGYFLKQHKLQGNWQLSPNRRELVRSTQPQ